MCKIRSISKLYKGGEEGGVTGEKNNIILALKERGRD